MAASVESQECRWEREAVAAAMAAVTGMATAALMASTRLDSEEEEVAEEVVVQVPEASSVVVHWEWGSDPVEGAVEMMEVAEGGTGRGALDFVQEGRVSVVDLAVEEVEEMVVA